MAKDKALMPCDNCGLYVSLLVEWGYNTDYKICKSCLQLVINANTITK